MPKSPIVFISYSFEDIEIAKNVSKILERYNVEVWLDIYQIYAGEQIEQKLKTAIQKAQFIVAIVTPSSVKSHWVTKELEIALENQNDIRSSRQIIPVVLDGTVIPDFLRNYRYILLRPYDYEPQLSYELARIIEPRLRDLSIYSNFQVQEIGYENSLAIDLSKGFTEKQFLLKKVNLEMGVSPDFKKSGLIAIQNATESFKHAALTYKKKANLTIGLMSLVIIIAASLFLLAGRLVSSEFKELSDLKPLKADTIIKKKNFSNLETSK